MLVATAKARYACPMCHVQPGEICRNLDGTALSKLTGTHLKRLHIASADAQVIREMVENMATFGRFRYGERNT